MVLLLTLTLARFLSRSQSANSRAGNQTWPAMEQTKWSRNPRTPDIRVVATLKVRRVERKAANKIQTECKVENNLNSLPAGKVALKNGKIL